MVANSWAVVSFCHKCQLTMAVDLELIVKVNGPDTDLWTKQSMCKRIGCHGTTELQAKPPELHHFFRLSAEWPAGLEIRGKVGSTGSER